MIHSAKFGSIERFFGVLTEHYAGAFPAWLAPVQVVGIPVTDEQVPYLTDVALQAAGQGHPGRGRRLRRPDAEEDPHGQQAEGAFVFIAGATDAEAGAVSFRYRDGSQRNGVPVDDAVEQVAEWIAARHNADPTAESGGVRRDERRRTATGSRSPTTAARRRLRAPLDAVPDGLHPRRGEADRRPRLPVLRDPDVSDEDGLIVARGSTVFAVLNLYPYNAGHLMLVPYRHVPDYTDLTAEEVAEVGAFTQTRCGWCASVSGAHGFNIGMNQGSVAGAGIADHLHQHVVPRWGGDTNFMPVIGLTRVLPQVLSETRTLLAEAWRPRPRAAAPGRAECSASPPGPSSRRSSPRWSPGWPAPGSPPTW